MAKLTKKEIELKTIIERGAFLSKQIKTLETEFNGIKDIIKMKRENGEIDEDVEVIAGNNNTFLSISIKESFEEPSPAVVQKELKKLGKESQLVDCVKILVEKTRKILGTDVYNRIKGKPKETVSLSFK